MRPTFAAIGAAAALTLLAPITASATASASAEHRGALPGHVFAPYFFNPADTLATTAQNSGVRFFTMAFLQTAAPGSCTVSWNGDPTTPVAPQTYGAGIAAVRAAGGDVIPSFGGAAADTSGTELADSCTDVHAIAAELQRVIDTYHVTRLDLDIEEDSLNDPANLPGIDRRNKAIALVQHWAAERHRTIQVVYTLPTNVSGLDPAGVHLLRNAIENHARVDIVNVMTFDYFDDQSNACQAGTGPAHQMAADTITAAGHLFDTLRTLHPRQSRAEVWRTIGITEDIGRDDFGPCETFTTADATTVEQWAKSRNLGEISFWNIQRDRTARSHTPQTDWQFSATFEPFTHR